MAIILQSGVYYCYNNNLLVERDVFIIVNNIINSFAIVYLTFGKRNFIDNLFVLSIVSLFTEGLNNLSLIVVQHVFYKIIKLSVNSLTLNLISFLCSMILLIPYFLFRKKWRILVYWKYLLLKK